MLNAIRINSISISGADRNTKIGDETLIFSNKQTEDAMKIVIWLEELSLMIRDASKKTK